MKKILVLYAKYGGGHLSAAKAITSFIEENYSNNYTVKCVDCMEYISMFLSNITTGAYKKLTIHTPHLWKKIYYGSRKGLISHISNTANAIMSKKLLKLFNEFKPDIVISTHPFSSQMTSYLKEHKKYDCTLATVLTDFAPHEQWLVGKDYNDFIFVSNDKMKQDMIDNYNIPEEKLFTTGIPLASAFSDSFYVDETYNKYNLKKDKKIILFFGGGEFGIGQKRTMQVFECLTKHLDKYQIIAISGKNEKLNNTFMNLSNKINNSDLHVLKYTNDVPELMHISSVVITKPGGLTSSESLASHLPIIISNPIPGQEEENAEFLENSGSAVWIKNDDDIDGIIDSVLNNEDKLNYMREKTKLIAKPHSTSDICKTILNQWGRR